jgi:hypothetical protein
VDLVIAGHRHRFSYTPPGPDVQHSYHLLVLGQGQVARVEATADELRVIVSGVDGTIVHTLVVPRRQGSAASVQGPALVLFGTAADR